MVNQPKQRIHRLKRLRAIEELYLAGYKALEIYGLLEDSYNVSRGTIRNDIVAIRKAWGGDAAERGELEGRERYLAAVRELRRKALEGWEEEEKIRGRDYKLAHQLDKEIARLSGVRLASDERTIHLDIQQARDFMDQVMTAVFEHVADAGVQEAIITDLEALGEVER